MKNVNSKIEAYDKLYSQQEPPKSPWWFILCVVIFLVVMIVVFWAMGAWAEDYSDGQIVNAIYQAEGAAKAQYAYGIRSIPYKTITDARRICFNTVRNNRKRFARQNKYTDFLEFLGSRYCPVGCNNDRGTNKFWVKNVRYYLAG